MLQDNALTIYFGSSSTILNYCQSNLLVACHFCRCKDLVNPPKKGYKFTNQPLKDLGIKFTPVHECLYEAVKSLQEKGFLQKTSSTKVIKKNTV